jgi:ATP-dependent DNA ligase
MKAVDLGPKIDWTKPDMFSQVGWLMGRASAYRLEPKVDGVRVTLETGPGGGMLLTSRNGHDRTRNFPHLTQAGLLPPSLGDVILDCELTARWHDGKPMLPATTGLVVAGPEHAAAIQELEGPAVLNVFDVLALSGQSTVSLPYHLRRDLLKELRSLLTATGYMRVVPSVMPAVSTCRKMLADGYEGVVFKRTDSTYRPTRSQDWLKLKRRAMCDAVITGYTPGKGQHEGKVGSLEVSLFCEQTEMWRKIGSVGNLSDLLRQRASTPSGRLAKGMYNRVVTVIAQGVGNNGHLRSPQLVELRADKPALECTADQLDAFPRV